MITSIASSTTDLKAFLCMVMVDKKDTSIVHQHVNGKIHLKVLVCKCLD